jgi:hypothetical protein
MFPFKVQLFQGCKSETEPINKICRATCYTITSIVGDTFDKICLYLPKPVFSHGQLYVALSRVRSLGSLSVVSETNEIFNCVYNEIYEYINKMR